MAMQEVCYTTNQQARCVTNGDVVVVQRKMFGQWKDYWSTECVDDEDVRDAVEFMEGRFAYH